MKRLLLMGPMLAWGGAASAQNWDTDQQSQCSAASQGAPFVERIDVATIDNPTPTTRVVQVDVAASRPDGRELTYQFHGLDGTMTSSGPRATWNVEGEGPFTATIEVSAPNYPCVSYVSVTYNVEAPAAEEPIVEVPTVEEPDVE